MNYFINVTVKVSYSMIYTLQHIVPKIHIDRLLLAIHIFIITYCTWTSKAPRVILGTRNKVK